MNTYRIIAKAGQIARCLLLVSFVVITSGCGGTYFLDTFSTDQLSSGYRWFDEGVPDSYSLTAKHGWLGINAGVRQDLWGGIPLKRGAPLLLRPAPEGDYKVDTFVSASPLGAPSQPVNTQIGLFVFQDVNNWLFFGLTNHDFSTPYTTNGLMVTKTVGGASSIVAGSGLAEDFVFLRIKKDGDEWKFYWKLQHDDAWNLLTTVKLPLKGHEVGMGVKTFDLDPPSATNSCQAYFDFFSIGAEK
jgi:hypothetical protein